MKTSFACACSSLFAGVEGMREVVFKARKRLLSKNIRMSVGDAPVLAPANTCNHLLALQ
jgi:hypothetical protein